MLNEIIFSEGKELFVFEFLREKGIERQCKCETPQLLSAHDHARPCFAPSPDTPLHPGR